MDGCACLTAIAYASDMHQVGEATMGSWEAAAHGKLGPLSSALFQADDRGPQGSILSSSPPMLAEQQSCRSVEQTAALYVQWIAWLAI